MKIKFSAKDPRAGMVAEVEADRGAALIEAGAATEVKEGVKTVEPEPAAKPASKKSK